MSSGTLGATLRHLRDLFSDGTAVGLGDGQLLARYAANRDEAAFEALVARHGPMVLATCRAVLRHEHDVEDAFQATFLVLARKARSVRAGDALGGWLHRVAYRAAVQAGAESRRRRRREVEASAMTIPAVTEAVPPVAATTVERARAAGTAALASDRNATRRAPRAPAVMPRLVSRPWSCCRALASRQRKVGTVQRSRPAACS